MILFPLVLATLIIAYLNLRPSKAQRNVMKYGLRGAQLKRNMRTSLTIAEFKQ